MNISEDVLSTGSSLASQVHAAAVNGDKGALQRLIVGNSALKDKEDQFGRTPLMYCVLADRLDCADALLRAGADVNKTDHSQRTALHLAAQKVRSQVTLKRRLCGCLLLYWKNCAMNK
ncbi:inversin-like isoform X1 [Grammomys surdaster]|uniref:inversin-like isoform X1 n=1 Tax=Grammomys surdaster TaxID=491861 RepID=UPI00109EF5E0|nr:inversin-like isoform X1 [Grammomys surdaster]